MVIKDIIAESAKKYPDKTAVVLGDTKCTFRELENRANSLANALIDMGVGKGDRVAVLLDNCLPYLEISCATAKGGMVMVPLNTGLSKQDLAYIINDIEVNTLFLGENYIDLFNSISDEIRGVRNLITIGTSSGKIKTYDELVSQYPPEEPAVEVGEQDTCIIEFSSGTTGLPKGIVSTNKRYLAALRKNVFVHNLTHDSIMFIPLPLSWAAAFIYTACYSGCTIVVAREFDQKTVLETIEREKATVSVMPPFYITSFMEYPRLKEYNLSSLERIVMFGAPMPEEVFKRAMEVFGNIFVKTYGTSESSWLTFLPPEDIIFEGPPEILRRLQSCGRAVINTEVRVVDENDNDVLPGQAGELIARTDSIIKEYWKLPQATVETFRGDYLYTGDTATIDEEGYIYLVGRKKDVITSGSDSIYPNEVEEVLHRHPAILETTVIGVPDVELGEAVRAVVVLKEGQKATEEEILDFCRQYLTCHAIPESVDFIDRLPRTSTGKILKRELKERYLKASAQKLEATVS